MDTVRMDTVQILLWAIGGLVAILGVAVVINGFFMKSWIQGIEKKIEKKLDAFLCEERNGDVRSKCDILFRHKHAPVRPDGTGGEVIIP